MIADLEAQFTLDDGHCIAVTYTPTQGDPVPDPVLGLVVRWTEEKTTDQPDAPAGSAYNGTATVVILRSRLNVIDGHATITKDGEADPETWEIIDYRPIDLYRWHLTVAKATSVSDPLSRY